MAFQKVGELVVMMVAPMDGWWGALKVVPWVGKLADPMAG